MEGKKSSPATIVALIGLFVVILGIVAIVATKGINFLGPMLMTPGPTGTMINPPTTVSDNLKNAGSMGEIKSFEIEAKNFEFVPNAIGVKVGDTVQINFKNNQGMHNLTISGYEISTKTIAADQSEQITFIATKKGNFEFYCSIGNHKAMGMTGVLVIQ